MATFDPLPDPAQVSSADAAARLAQAQAANAAWRSNTGPVLPRYGNPSGITQEEQADAAREQAKHMAAFHPEEYYGVSISSMANVPLSQIASRYGSGFADIVQGYYTRNPTAEAQAINQAYAYRQAQTIGSEGVMQQREIAATNPFDPNSAAGIAWLTARQGGVVSESLGLKAISEGYKGDLFAVKGMSTVPTRDYSSGMVSGTKLVAALPDQTVTTYMPYGEYAQIKLENTKILMGYNTGELGVYQQPYGRSIYNLVGGAGRNALQSGMFTVEKPETPFVVSQGEIGTYVLPSGKGMSRLGAEAYGGYVTELSGRTLEPTAKFSQYENVYNLANYVNPQGPNLGKAAAPGANIPWEVNAKQPAMQYMGTEGIIPGSAIAIPGEGGRLVGGKTVASEGTIETTKEPFVSARMNQEKMTFFGIEVPEQIAAIPKGITSVESSIRGYLPAPEIVERGAKVASFANPFTMPYAVERVITGKESYGESALGTVGQYTTFYEHPTSTAVSFAVGGAFGGAARGVSEAVTISKGYAAEQIISKGGTWRTAEQLTGKIMAVKPSGLTVGNVLTGLYAADIGYRSTRGFTSFEPSEVTQRGRGLVIQEAVPMAVGFGAAYNAPTSIYAKVEPTISRAKLEFPQFVEEAGGSVAKAIPQYAGYKISQTPAYEAAKAPITRAKLEIPQFIEEAGGSVAKGVGAYARYKIERPVAELQARVDVGVERLLHPSRFKGVEGTENIYQPKSTLNIFGKRSATTPTRKLTGEQPPIPGSDVEIRSSGGMVQVARVAQRPVAMMERPMQTQTMESRTMPEYPRGPSPFQTQRYRVEEETQYLVLPPGMVSPGPKRQTIQEIVVIPSTAMGQVSAQVISPVQRVGSDVISRQVQRQAQRQGAESAPRMAQFQLPWQSAGFAQRFDISTTPRTTTTPRTDVTTVPRVDVSTIPRTTTVPWSGITTVPRTDISTIPRSPEYPKPKTPGPEIPAPFGVPTLGGGAPGGGGRLPRRAAFVETFMMGLDLSAMGRRTKRAKSWTTPKKYKAKKKGGKK